MTLEEFIEQYQVGIRDHFTNRSLVLETQITSITQINTYGLFRVNTYNTMRKLYKERMKEMFEAIRQLATEALEDLDTVSV